MASTNLAISMGSNLFRAIPCNIMTIDVQELKEHKYNAPKDG